jgi:hypothetical protein
MGRSRERGFGNVRKWLRNPLKIYLTRPSDLGEFPRLVFALKQMGFWTASEIVGAIFQQHFDQNHEFQAKLWAKLHKRTQECLDWIHTSTHPVVKFVLDNGLPRNCGTWLPEGRTVHCAACGCYLTVVPCVKCTSCEVQDETLVKVFGQFERRTPGKKHKTPRPTDAYPGTPEKIQVLRERLERGEALFSKKDRQINQGVIAGNQAIAL